MTKRSAFQTLADIAHQQTDNSAIKLAHLNASNQKAEEKLNLLLQYRDDYQARFEASAQSGISQLEWSNYQEFMLKLDKAIAQQESIVMNSQHQVEAGQKEWQTHHRKFKTFDTLCQRQLHTKAKQTLKQEQNEQDEQAAKAHARKVDV